jgi:hypothetical protein
MCRLVCHYTDGKGWSLLFSAGNGGTLTVTTSYFGTQHSSCWELHFDKLVFDLDPLMILILMAKLIGLQTPDHTLGWLHWSVIDLITITFRFYCNWLWLVSQKCLVINLITITLKKHSKLTWANSMEYELTLQASLSTILVIQVFHYHGQESGN